MPGKLGNASANQVIVSDWMMSCMDGLELCRKIRAEETSQLSYIILITAREGKANYLDAMNSGVDDFMSKPVERDRFIARVGVAIRILGLKKELTEKQEASVRQILESGRRFLTLIDFILGFSKSDPSELSFDVCRRPANGD